MENEKLKLKLESMLKMKTILDSEEMQLREKVRLIKISNENLKPLAEEYYDILSNCYKIEGIPTKILLSSEFIDETLCKYKGSNEEGLSWGIKDFFVTMNNLDVNGIYYFGKLKNKEIDLSLMPKALENKGLHAPIYEVHPRLCDRDEREAKSLAKTLKEEPFELLKTGPFIVDKPSEFSFAKALAEELSKRYYKVVALTMGKSDEEIYTPFGTFSK